MANYVLVPADNAHEALEATKDDEILGRSARLTVRVATPDEVKFMDEHEKNMQKARTEL